MDVLVIGGSVFLGRAVVEEALARGDRVTVFNRGLSGTTPPGVEQVRGDRTDAADVEQLAGRRFDLVVDTCGYVPADVALSARVLSPHVGFYAFVSSINAYPGWPRHLDYAERGVHDGDPDATRDNIPEGMQEPDPYGWLKVGCERAVTRAFGERRSVLRAGLIVGPHDRAIGRLPWWIDRIARGGEVLVPGSPGDPVALVDARDLARFALSGVAGEFETPGRAGDTRDDVVSACRAATGSDAGFTYVADDWLAEQGVEPWTEVPLWIPPGEGPAVFRPHGDAAAAAGLSWRPLTETVADTWEWQRSLDPPWTPAERTPGLAPDREAELLHAWKHS
ncbi:NAD-dependent epimerase/dehydratase family protein [uncultured Jatrophihabitans sp.]|uniref:NAD-dependent epimerase/dehydratase family protein n=1 Tax=uncultured Jatrophihabitans sp. TaxID=1610747 RepID=UPI0035C9C84C